LGLNAALKPLTARLFLRNWPTDPQRIHAGNTKLGGPWGPKAMVDRVLRRVSFQKTMGSDQNWGGKKVTGQEVAGGSQRKKN